MSFFAHLSITKLSVIVLLIGINTPVNAHAEWIKVSESSSGDTYYVDFERIRKNSGHVYFWTLLDYIEPIEGVFSDITYNKGDCNEFKYKWLQVNYHMGSMGVGEIHPASGEPTVDAQKWRYPAPKSIFERVLNSVCSQ